MISVDAKKEVVGDSRTQGRSGNQWVSLSQSGFMTPSIRTLAKSPLTIYELPWNEGYVSLGVTHDTPESEWRPLRRWWAEVGRPTFAALPVQSDSFHGDWNYRIRSV